MAIKKIFPRKDTTIYSFAPELNSGLDEILEVNTYTNLVGSEIPHSTRVLIDFDSNDINNIISGSNNYEINLRLSSAIVNGLNLDTIIDVFPLSDAWEMGTGKYGYEPEISDGTSWYWKNYNGGETWISSSFQPYTTASYISTNPGGGVWYTNLLSNPSESIVCNQTFQYQGTQNYNIGENLIDLKIDITSIVNEWFNDSGFTNNGLILKQREEFNTNPAYTSEFKFFSIDTNTIYPPYLEIKYNDAEYNTGSNIQTIDTDEIYVNINMNSGFFHPDEKNMFRINVRPKYPIRTFQTSSIYTQNFYLPENSCYAIKDLDTNEYVIDFDDEFTKISADSNSSYFNLDMDGLQWERYYKILIKTVINNKTLIFDDKFYFKIIKN